MRDVTICTIGTDGKTDFLQIPDGTRLNLNTISVLDLVAAAVPRKHWAIALDTFNERGSVAVEVDLDRAEALMQSAFAWRRVAADPLIDEAVAGTAMLATVTALETHVENMVQRLGTKTAAMNRGRELLKRLVASLDADKIYSEIAESPVLASADAATVDSAHADISNTLTKIASLQEKGKRFNADAARLDLYHIASDLAEAASVADSSRIRAAAADARRLYEAFHGPR